MSKKEMHHLLKEKETRINELSSQLERERQVTTELRLDYSRELVTLREQLFKKKAMGAKFEAVEVRYFNATDGLPEDIAVALNQRLKEVRESY